ncbi:MAG: hypothetical protein KF789_04485 [Bdellovibrionaceae bacterium]|nr:hypothetical protein [Pseudobdellovibrionaceae bacterium]
MSTIKNAIKQIGYFAVILIVASATKVFVRDIFGHTANKNYNKSTIQRVWREQELLGLKLETPTTLVKDKNDFKFPPEVEEMINSYEAFTGQSKSTYLNIGVLNYKNGVEYNLQMGARGAVYEALSRFNSDEPEIEDDKYSNGAVSGILASGQKTVKGKTISAKAFVFKTGAKVYVLSALTFGDDLKDDSFSRVSQSVSILEY